PRDQESGTGCADPAAARRGLRAGLGVDRARRDRPRADGARAILRRVVALARDDRALRTARGVPLPWLRSSGPARVFPRGVLALSARPADSSAAARALPTLGGSLRSRARYGWLDALLDAPARDHGDPARDLRGRDGTASRVAVAYCPDMCRAF